jgi:hypothetical protein
LTFVAFNLLTFGLGAYKAYNLGLLPTDADWAMGLSPKNVRFRHLDSLGVHVHVRSHCAPSSLPAT